MGDSVGVSFGCLADCLDALVNKGFYLNLSLSMLFSPPHARSGVKGQGWKGEGIRTPVPVRSKQAFQSIWKQFRQTWEPSAETWGGLTFPPLPTLAFWQSRGPGHPTWFNKRLDECRPCCWETDFQMPQSWWTYLCSPMKHGRFNINVQPSASPKPLQLKVHPSQRHWQYPERLKKK